MLPHFFMIMKQTPPVLTLTHYAMATQFELTLYGKAEHYLRTAGEQVFALIDDLEAQMSFYRRDSDITDINARAYREPVHVEPRLFHLLQRIQRWHEETEGAFDITVAPLLECWGFVGGTGSLPTETDMEEARARVGMQHVLLDAEERTIRFARAGMRLDLGAVGKGYAIDCAVELLQELEIENALLHGGTSSVYALGNAPEGSPWRIAVQTPYGAAGHYLAEVALSGQSLSISAPHSKSFEQEGVRYGHVIDPRTGYPAQSSRLAALLMPSAAQGDALSTGLLALGPTGLATLSKYYPDLQGMVVLDTENHGQERTLLGSAWKVQTKT